MNKRLWKAGLLCTIFAAAPATLAADFNEGGFWYAGAALGEVELDVALSEIADGSLLTQGNIDDSDTAWSIYGGYQFNDYFAIEGSYLDFGDITISAMSDGSGLIYDAGSVEAVAEATGFTLEGIAQFPFTSSFAGFAKVGAFFWDADLTLRNVAFGTMADDDSDTDLTYGVGLAYQFRVPFSLRAEWQRYEFDDVDGDLIALAGTFQFGRK